MHRSYPLTFEVASPLAPFERAHVALRIIVLFFLGLLGLSVCALAGIVYVALPIAAAVLAPPPGTTQRRETVRMVGWIRWIMDASAYFALVTDELPTEAGHDPVRLEVVPTGVPTVGSALLRLVKSIPAAIVLGLLTAIGTVVWLIAAVSILVCRRYAAGLRTYLIGVLRYQARLLAYHASLVTEYPPFELDEAHPSIASS